MMGLVASTQVNSGSAGGNIWYIDLGTIREAWGLTASINTSTSTAGKIITFPVGFFTTIQAVLVSPTNMSSTGNQYAAIAGYTTTDMTIYIYTVAGTGTAQGHFYVKGT